VVKAPKHPYTQLLIASIPQVSTERTWLDEQQGGVRAETGSAGCRFVARCPVAMPICRETAPPPVRTEADRVVACYRYEETR